jgi:hypothetical protein
MRLTVLYLRSRHVPAAMAMMVIATASLCALGLATPQAGLAPLLTALAAAIGAAAVAPGLSGTDRDLDRAAAIPWPTWRTAHVLAATLVATGLIVATRPFGPSFAGPAVTLRDTAGLIGVTALGAALIGASRAWMLPLAWTAFLLLGRGAVEHPWYKQAETWLLQPPGTASANLVAAGLLLCGALAYALNGSRD